MNEHLKLFFCFLLFIIVHADTTSHTHMHTCTHAQPLTHMHTHTHTHMHTHTHSCTQTQETHALITTILDVQPRLAGSEGGKTSDEIVYELAENILNRLPEKLDLEKASPELFQVSTCFVRMANFTNNCTKINNKLSTFQKYIPVHFSRSCFLTTRRYTEQNLVVLWFPIDWLLL